MTWTFMDVDAWRARVAGLNPEEYFSNFAPPHNVGAGSATYMDSNRWCMEALSQPTLSTSITPPSPISSISWTSPESDIITWHKREKERLHEERERMTAENKELEKQRDAAVGDAEMWSRECAALRNAMEGQSTSRKGKGPRMHKLMASDGARQRLAQEDAKRADRKRKVEEAKKRRREKAAAPQAQGVLQDVVMSGTEIYKGRLASKLKAELQDIATALSLSADGTKFEIIQRIQERLDSAPGLRQDQRFSGLYSSRGRGRYSEGNMQPTTQGDISNAAPIAGPSQRLIHYSADQTPAHFGQILQPVPSRMHTTTLMNHYHSNYPMIS